MQVLCMVTSHDTCDVQCPFCSQKYVVYYSRIDKAECAQALEAVRVALLEHHLRSPLPTAHPGDAFTVPPWNGPVHASAAALLSGAPVGRPVRSRPAPLTFVPNIQQRRVS
jgi:hypothetical protein